MNNYKLSLWKAITRNSFKGDFYIKKKWSNFAYVLEISVGKMVIPSLVSLLETATLSTRKVPFVQLFLAKTKLSILSIL